MNNPPSPLQVYQDMIDKRPITQVLTLQCPCCSAPRLEVHPNTLKVIGGKYWLSDGDTIGPLWSKLSDVQKARNDFDYEMLYGDCPSCGGGYYVAEAKFMAGKRELIEQHLYGNIAPISSTYFQCVLTEPLDGVPSHWLCAVDETIQGPMYTHTFGPFALESPEGVLGKFGVSYCEASSSNDAWEHSARILLTLWEEFRRPLVS